MQFSACTETVDIMKLYLNNHVEVAVAWLAHFTLLVMFRIMAWTLIIICAGWSVKQSQLCLVIRFSHL